MPRNEPKSQKSSLRLGALTRVISQTKLKIDETVPKPLVQELAGTLTRATICLQRAHGLSSFLQNIASPPELEKPQKSLELS